MTTGTAAKPPRARPAAITLTPAAQDRIASLIARATGPVAGVRLSTPKRGCSGLSYSIEYAQSPQPGDEAIETPSGPLFIDGGSLLHLIGSVMDWKEDDFAAGFVFTNPNAKGSCGCGESFTI